MVDSFKLCNRNGPQIEVPLYDEKRQYSAEVILNTKLRVYEDAEYFIFMDEGSDSVSVYLNGSELKTYNEGKNIVLISPENREKIFMGMIGFVQISLRFDQTDGTELWRHSDYLAVMVPSSRKNQSIDDMLGYIYKNQSDFLLRSVSITKAKEMGTKLSIGDFASQISVLQEIVGIYENCFGYFKVNSRCKLDVEYIVDRTDRLQTVGAPTIQHMIQHPEHLKQSPIGIRVGRQVFLPDKTLTTRNRITRDIYENRVIVSFLKRVLDDTVALERKILSYVNQITIEKGDEEGYMLSAIILYNNARKVLEGYCTEIISLRNKIERLYLSYSRIFSIAADNLILQPKPTAIFLSVPQYNKIYTSIIRWFARTGYDLENERALLNLYSAPDIYELYVLLRMIYWFKSKGYSLLKSFNIRYPMESVWNVKNKEYNNTFCLEKDGCEITIYYEPVIYDEPRPSINGISLYRNNTVSFSEDTDEERAGHYYTPDYLIKTVKNGITSYSICDAKFSKKDKVRFNLMPGLAYKYLYSVSPADDSELISMNIFYALADGAATPSNFYDKEKDRKIYPITNMVPISSEMTDWEITKCLEKVFEGLLSE